MEGPWRDSAGASVVDVMLDVDVQTYLPDDLLVKMDIATMASSLEARSPLLDHELMEFAAALPAELKVRGREKKVVLRGALRGWVPDEILDAPKRGFRLPLGDWLRGELRDYARDVLLDRRAVERGCFREPYVRELLDRHAAGRAGPLAGDLDAADVRALAPGVRRRRAAATRRGPGWRPSRLRTSREPSEAGFDVGHEEVVEVVGLASEARRMLGHEFDPVEARDLPVDLGLQGRRMTAPQVTKLSDAPAVEGRERDRLEITLSDVGLESGTFEQHVTERHRDGEACVQPVRGPVERPKEEIDGSTWL